MGKSSRWGGKMRSQQVTRITESLHLLMQDPSGICHSLALTSIKSSLVNPSPVIGSFPFSSV